jgi:hypothetical protein
VDPLSFWSAGSGPGSKRANITHKSEDISSSEVLDVLFGGLKTSLGTWTSFMEA